MREILLHPSPHVGDFIRFGRALRGLSQRKLAEGVGFPTIRLWRLENGVVHPKSAELAAIADVLDLPVLREAFHASAKPVVNNEPPAA